MAGTNRPRPEFPKQALLARKENTYALLRGPRLPSVSHVLGKSTHVGTRGEVPVETTLFKVTIGIPQQSSDARSIPCK